MITLLLAGALLAGTTPEPVDPDLEVIVIEASFDAELICPAAREMYDLLNIVLQDSEMTMEFITAFAVENYEDGYGQNLQRPAEIRLEELIEGCIR